MSVASEITRIKNNISFAYTSLESKGATLPETQNSANLATTIESIPTGGSVVTEQALNLYDWEGTLLKSYTAAEAQALTELPNPSDCPAYSAVDHELLLFQEWNWSLADIKTWLTNHAQGKLNVGAIYTTTDGQDHNYWASPRGEGSKLINRQKRATASIGGDAFYSYGSLTSINIPDGVISIGTYAFQNCPSLTSINIPNGVTSIGNNAFSGCVSLTLINIPDSVTSIWDRAFSSCGSLTSINIPDGVTSIRGDAFSGCVSLTSINIPDGVTSIGNYAFQNCGSLTSINIPDGVTSIGEGAFQDCASLTSINIPDGVTFIGTKAFSNCYSLTSIKIPDGETSIGKNTFYNCKNLFDILLENKITLSSSDGLSYTPSTQKIYVPRANLSWFETATNWSTYYSRFAAIEDNITYLESLGYNVDAYK